YPDSLNDYTYAWNQPLDYVDLDGNVPIIIGIPDVNVEAVNKGIEIGTWGKNKIKSGVDWGKDKVKSGINWTKNKIKKHAGYKYSEEREDARGIDYREGEIRGNNFFVLTETRIEKIDGIIEHKRGFEINAPKVEKWRFRLPSFNLSYSDGAVSVGGDGGFRAFGREVDLSSALHIELGSDLDILEELEGAIDGTIYGGKTGVDGDGFYINGIGGGEFVDGFTLKSEREMYRKPIDWLKVKMGIAAIVLAAIIITNAWSLTTIPLIPVGERLVYEGSAAMIISYLFGQSNVAYGESLN